MRFKKYMEYEISDFIKHFDSMQNDDEIEDILNFNEKNVFWSTTKELLIENDYKLLKEEIIGKDRKSKIRAKRRNI